MSFPLSIEISPFIPALFDHCLAAFGIPPFSFFFSPLFDDAEDVVKMFPTTQTSHAAFFARLNSFQALTQKITENNELANAARHMNLVPMHGASKKLRAYYKPSVYRRGL